jgi:hypothetical protein
LATLFVILCGIAKGRSQPIRGRSSWAKRGRKADRFIYEKKVPGEKGEIIWATSDGESKAAHSFVTQPIISRDEKSPAPS